MEQSKLNVQLLEVTQNALSVIYFSARQCYSPEFAGEIFKNKIAPDKQEKFIEKIISSGHLSPLEHVKFTFAIEGVSRALTHQLVRHRIASYSQQSQRYVKENNFKYIVPPSIEKDENLKKEFKNIMGEIQKTYNKILKATSSQDARFVLPQAAETKIVITMNARELLHFFEERCCARAQWEIRKLAYEMLLICKRELSAVFSTAGQKCLKLGYCPEGKFSCGLAPLKEKALKR
ncbi:MAG: FAD-dependent thymidylate synthase [bacterium]|nr:FAD-dependent thymidylate synthase [bacterium]